MGRPREDFALLLSAADRTTLALAQELLLSRGIPSLVHEIDGASSLVRIDLGEGSPATHAQLYVPKRARANAETILREAWGAEGFERHA